MTIDQFKERIKLQKNNKSEKKNNSKNQLPHLSIKDRIVAEIKKIYDPEIPVNIYELGLIYDIKVDEKNNVKINMTLTTPNCPVAESLPKEVKDSIMEIKEVNKVDLDLVWDPPWDKSMMTEAAKLELNL